MQWLAGPWVQLERTEVRRQETSRGGQQTEREEIEGGWEEEKREEQERCGKSG